MTLLVKVIRGEGHNAGSALMAMGLQHFLIVSLVLTAPNTDTSGY